MWRRRAADYTDAKSNRTVFVHHARLSALNPDTAYLYAALHDGVRPEFAAFRTAPRGRSAFTFTSFGDQGTPTVGKQFVPPAGVALPRAVFVNDNLGSPAAADTTLGVERVQPLFHLLNGDLCYANIADDRVRSWWDFWENNSRSARNRPWMPCAGNHENELGNGPIGYLAYQSYFTLPEASGQTDLTRGLWYAFTAGSVRVISLANDDICYQDSGNSYVRGYSAGAQKAWLEKELAETRANARSTGWSSACTRWRSRPPTSSMGPTSAPARNGCRYSINTASIWWCAGTNTITNARIPFMAGRRTARSRRNPSAWRRTWWTPAKAPSTW